MGGVAFVRENSKSSKHICIYEEKLKQTKNTRGKNRGLPWPPRGGGKPRNFLEDRKVKVEQESKNSQKAQIEREIKQQGKRKGKTTFPLEISGPPQENQNQEMKKKRCAE